MPHEVVAKILLIVVAIALAGIASAVLLYFMGVGSVKAEIIIERFELGQGSGILAIRNVSNIKIVRIDRLELVCSSGATMELDPGMIPTPMPPGLTHTIIFHHDAGAGDSCKILIEGEAEGGYRFAASSAEAPVI
jgi:hypothetical protein